jgi:hypothetical protein
VVRYFDPPGLRERLLHAPGAPLRPALVLAAVARSALFAAPGDTKRALYGLAPVSVLGCPQGLEERES